jgi:hypothetical protein
MNSGPRTVFNKPELPLQSAQPFCAGYAAGAARQTISNPIQAIRQGIFFGKAFAQPPMPTL